jgi:hypothetical protein
MRRNISLDQRTALYSAWVVIGALILGTLLVVAFVACEGDGDRSPAASTGPVFCKSPTTGQMVPLRVAMRQARAHNQRMRALGLQDGNPSIIQTIDCGDDVVFVTPVFEPESTE